MINIQGSVRRSFIFPAELAIAYAYYSDTSRLLNYFPHISMVRAYTSDKFRMLYKTTELGAYHIRIFWDVRTMLDETDQVIHIRPLENTRPVKAKAGISSSTAQGYFNSESAFFHQGKQTRIEYKLKLQAELPTPLGLCLMPALVTNRIAKNITNARMREIAKGFIELSIDAFPHWLAEMSA